MSRRDLGRLFATGVVLTLVPAGRALAGTSRPVVGFHNDAPWLDPTGRDLPYRLPVVGAAAAADSESLMRLGHFL